MHLATLAIESFGTGTGTGGFRGRRRRFRPYFLSYDPPCRHGHRVFLYSAKNELNGLLG